jgi:UPF0755 protein
LVTARLSWWLGATLVVIAAVGGLGAYLWRGIVHPLPLAANRVEFRVGSGASARGIARSIRYAGVDLNELEFIGAVKATGATRHLRAGRYAIEEGMSIRSLVDMLKRGDVLRERLTIPEGSTFRELREMLAATEDLQHDSARLDNASLLRAVGAPERHPEGIFAPDTYVFDPGSSDLEILRRAYRTQAERLARAWGGRAPGLPYGNAYEALIMASIIEKETGRPDERGLVAGVFVNRRRRGMPLQTDPTIIYGLGDRYDGHLHHDDLLLDTPYNTYLHAGLPPSPIALPGRASIEAALNPDKTPAIYFVARGDGTSEFSSTLADHNKAVNRFQRSGARTGASSAASASASPAADGGRD